MREEDLYPAEHPFIQTLKESDNPNETPFTTTTSGFPLYKGSYLNRSHQSDAAPEGFHHNRGNQFISYPIWAAHSEEVQQAQYVQAIMSPNLLMIGLHNDTNKVYSKLLYASPIYQYNGKLIYTAEELEFLKFKVED